jgi:hypothetical protein
MIQSSILRGDYGSVDAMESDVDLMVNNAKTFNEEDSFVYDCACALWVRLVDVLLGTPAWRVSVQMKGVPCPFSVG